MPVLNVFKATMGVTMFWFESVVDTADGDAGFLWFLIAGLVLGAVVVVLGAALAATSIAHLVWSLARTRRGWLRANDGADPSLRPVSMSERNHLHAVTVLLAVLFGVAVLIAGAGCPPVLLAEIPVVAAIRRAGELSSRELGIPNHRMPIWVFSVACAVGELIVVGVRVAFVDPLALLALPAPCGVLTLPRQYAVTARYDHDVHARYDAIVEGRHVGV